MTTITPTPTSAPPRASRSGWSRAAGIAALVEAATFVVGIGLFATVLSDYATGDVTAERSVAFLVDHQGALHLWHIVTMIVFGIALVPLALGLHDRMKAAAPGLSSVATALGLVWSGLVLAAGMVANVGVGAVAELAGRDPAQAATLWTALDTVQDGLGGGNEVAGGVWLALVSVAALRTGALPRGLGLLGVVAAGAGLVTVVPGLSDVGLVFGLGLIVWFAWLGAFLLREGR